ncbi:LysM domain-containing protein [Halopseudomonas litoralis]|uniref:LysM domain-containing protein n=1 Tax=Halopseudomonas litoralis TaxID=797277 RepID=A0A1H1SIG8_9GAMM|nr:LysM domain-containing protein [Halopseudomonas litoralis]SDS47752.1 LysM domain-containing protein [Halopseudomonas litoralis]
MEFDNYLVVTGDTLGDIAQQHGTTVERLLQLNPFIRNADHIQAGWNLSVPRQAAEAVTAGPDTQPATASGSMMLELGPEAPIDESCDVTFDDGAPACNTRFAGILYATEERQFWLLPEPALDAIGEATSTLANRISPDKPAHERQQGLDESGLLEYFLQPKLTNFLSGDDLTRALQIEAQVPDIDNWYYWWSLKAQDLNLPRNPFDRPQMRHPYSEENREHNRQAEAYIRQAKSRQAEMEALHRERAELQQLHEEWATLQKKALAVARSEGYAYENGALFSPDALEARKRVQRYLDERQQVMRSNLNADAIAEILAEGKALEQESRLCLQPCYGQLDKLHRWRMYNLPKLELYQDYIDAILDVADYGLAVPEYALTPNPSSGLAAGERALQVYLEAQRHQAAVTARLQKKYQDWVRATGTNAPPPAGLVDAEQQEWDELQKLLDDLHQQAHRNLKASPIRRHLLWDPEQFTPRPVERLVRGDFPLREASLLGTGNKVVEALSLFDLSNIGEQLKANGKKVVDDLGKAIRRIPINDKRGLSTTTSLFQQWLEGHGAIAIHDQAGDWFDKHGWFEVDQLSSYLQARSIKVAQLEDAAARQAWGQNLRQMLFRADIRDHMRLFDPSPSAQLVRCLTPPQDSLHNGVTVKGPSLSLAGGLQTSVKANIGIDLAQGVVELFSVNLPARAEAKDLMLTYLNHSGEQVQFSLGRYSMHLSALAWGYAGAAMLLSASISLAPNHPAWGKPGLTAEERAQRRGADLKDRIDIRNGAGAQFSVFAGIQAGVSLTGALNWAPPSHIATLRTLPAGRPGAHSTSPDNHWLSLASLNAGVAAAAGVGANAQINLSLTGGQLMLSMKASLVAGPGVKGEYSFAISYAGVVDLINLFRRELHRNHGNPLEWVTDDAASFMSKLITLGANGLSVPMLYLMGLDTIMSLYEALTDGARGGPIALAIMEYENTAELAQWFIEAPPAALGPILMTLTAAPRSFSVTNTTVTQDAAIRHDQEEISREQCRSIQQRAIDRIFSWITVVAKASDTNLERAQQQFGHACMHMNRFGVPEPNLSRIYRRNRLKLDLFMAAASSTMAPGMVGTQERYKSNIAILAATHDSTHEYHPDTNYVWARGVGPF